MDPKEIAEHITEDLDPVINLETEPWFNVLKDQEKIVLRKYVETPYEEYWNKEDYRFGNWFISMLHEINELIPFSGERLDFNTWFDEALSAGIITGQERSRLIRFCVENLYF